jgi:hypothetical protein
MPCSVGPVSGRVSNAFGYVGAMSDGDIIGNMLRLILVSVIACSLFAAPKKFGKPLTLKEASPISQVSSAPETFEGKIIQVKGKVSEVCEMMGCWMVIVDPETGKNVKVKVKDGEMVFPKDAIGKTAIAEGKFVKISLTQEQAIAQAKHEAEEQGRTFDPSTITGPVVRYQIQGLGAVIQ